MNHPLQPRDEFDDEQISQLLCQNAPVMDREFAVALGARLDAAFAKTLLVSPAPASDRADAINMVPARKPRLLRKNWRWPLVGAVAALLFFGIFSNGPSYSWSQMVEALRAKPWIQTDFQQGKGENVVRWVSSAGIVAERSADGAVLANRHAGFVLSYRNNSGSITQTPISSHAQGASLPEALAILLPKFAASSPVALDDLEVVEQTWQRTANQLVELQVTLQLKGNNARQVRAVFLIAADTHLPVSCTLLEDTGIQEQVQFQYPNEGPETIYALGAPESSPIVPVNAANEPADLRTKRNERNTEIAQSEATSTPMTSEQLAQAVDDLLQSKWQQINISPAEPATDEEYLRRLYLDLVGRIPTVGETRQFLEDTSVDRRQQLVDKLLQSRNCATHFAGIWRRMLIPEGSDLSRFGGFQAFEEWLADHFQKNTPYDQLVRELLLAEGRISESGPLLFYAALKMNPEEIAAQTSRTFLGTKLECAQCHDHPFDATISQKDFWGLAAVFARISRPRGEMTAISPVLQVHDASRGEVMLPDTETIIPPQLPFSREPIFDEANGPSRRLQFVDWLTSRENEYFAKSTVNRLWSQLFGRGLVEPVDDMRAPNAAICPELLDLLAEQFVLADFDLHWLMRCLASTEAYGLSSRSKDSSSARTLHFAQMNLKPFSAEQLYDCINVVAGTPMGKNGNAQESTLVRIGDSRREAFIELFHAPGMQSIDYQAGIPQALTLMHGEVVHSATEINRSGVLQSLMAPFFTDEQRLETLFLATLSRLPTAVEKEQALNQLPPGAAPADRNEWLSDVLWALLNSAEFTMNH